MAWDLWPPKRRTKRQTAQSAWQDAIARLAFRFEANHTKAEDWLLSRVKAYTDSPISDSKYCAGIANWLTAGNYDDPDEAWQRDDDESAPSMYPEIQPI